MSTEPRLVAVDASGSTIDGTPVRLVYSGSLPRKRLSSRLHELRVALGENAETADAHRVLLEAVKVRTTAWAIREPDMQALQALVTEWKSGDSQVESASDMACDELPVELDERWCMAIEQALGANARKFDDTPFAVLRVGASHIDRAHPPVVLGAGATVPGHDMWTVHQIGSLVLRVGR